jgi:hypothetical protein
MLQLGMETSSQRLLDLMCKGTCAADAGPILRNLAAVGIRTYVYLLFGIPSETLSETQQTVEWVADHADSITFLNLARMNLPRGSELERSRDRGGLTEFEESATDHDLSLYRGVGAGHWELRRRVRRTLSEAQHHPTFRCILARTPPGFTSNHAAFAPFGTAQK